MRRVRSLCFDSLEERKLLSRAHIAAHAKPAAAATRGAHRHPHGRQQCIDDERWTRRET